MKASIWLGVILTCVLGVTGAAFADDSSTTSDNPPVVTAVQNEYVAAQIGLSGEYTPPDKTPQYVTGDETTFPVAGYFNVSTTNGDPDVDSTSRISLMANTGAETVPNVACLLIRVGDGTSYTDYRFGDPDAGSWEVTPGVLDGTNELYGLWNVKDTGISVAMRITLIRDMVKFDFKARNVSTTDEKVGFKFLYIPNVYPKGSGGGQGPFYFSGKGKIDNEGVWEGGQIPEFWKTYAYDTSYSAGDNNKPYLVLRHILRDETNGEVVAPDKMALGWWTRMGAWDFTPDTSHQLSTGENATAVGLWWNPKTVRADNFNEYEISTLFGLGNATEDLSYPGVLSVHAPYKVTFAAGSTTGISAPIKILAQYYNLSKVDQANVNMTISLPSGLTLASGEKATKSVANGVAGGKEGGVSWNVVASQNAPGLTQFSVSCDTAPFPISKTVTREIAIAGSSAHQYTTGWQMISVPFAFKDATPSTALGLTSGTYNMWQWDNINSEYSGVTSVNPGTGFWIKSTANKTVNVPTAGGNATILDPTLSTTAGVMITLNKGWNLVGNPYTIPLNWISANVLQNPKAEDQPVSMTQAINNGWLGRTMFWWDSVEGPTTGTYNYASTTKSLIMAPWQGYWIKTNTKCWVFLTPPTTGDWYSLDIP